MSEPGLFDSLPRRRGNESKQRERIAAYGSCPTCINEKVGLVRSPDGTHFVWRDHNLITHAGTRLQCQSVAQRLCDAPAVPVIGYDTPRCPHAASKQLAQRKSE
jgi:hypothetical protein